MPKMSFVLPRRSVHRTDARVRRKCAGRCVQSEGMEMIMEEKDTELRDEGLRGNEKIEEAIAGLRRSRRRKCWHMR